MGIPTMGILQVARCLNVSYGTPTSNIFLYNNRKATIATIIARFLGQVLYV